MNQVMNYSVVIYQHRRNAILHRSNFVTKKEAEKHAHVLKTGAEIQRMILGPRWHESPMLDVCIEYIGNKEQ